MTNTSEDTSAQSDISRELNEGLFALSTPIQELPDLR